MSSLLPFSHGHSLFRMAGAPPSYCFVAFPPRAKDGLVVFGKNSARPRDEVQEVVYFPAADHEPESKVEVSLALQHLHSLAPPFSGFDPQPSDFSLGSWILCRLLTPISTQLCS
jgi:hypothetical protein